jgi:hypothetical protein
MMKFKKRIFLMGVLGFSSLAFSQSASKFQGTVDTNWNNAANWNNGLPDATKNVLILNHCVVPSGSNVTCAKLNIATIFPNAGIIVQNNATLTIASGGELAINDTGQCTIMPNAAIIMNNGAITLKHPGCLYVKSDATGSGSIFWL